MKPLDSAETVRDLPLRIPVQHWFTLRSGSALPRMADWPLASDPLADYRMLTDIRLEPLNIRYGAVGAKLEELYGKPIGGRDLDDLYNDWFRSRTYDGYKVLLHERCPVYEKRSFSTIVRSIGYHKLHLPFGQGDQVTQAVSYLLPVGGNFSKRADWESMVQATPWL